MSTCSCKKTRNVNYCKRCERLSNGEGVPGRFFAMRNRYLFIGQHKYSLMIPPDQVDWDKEEVLNRAPLYRDRRDFVIQDGDSGMHWDYPTNPDERS